VPKESITIENFREHPIREGIVELLIHFGRENGLTAKQFKFALVKEYATNHQIESDPEIKKNIKECKIFFKDIDVYYDNGIIKRGCANNEQIILYHLNILIQLGMVKKDKRWVTPHYKLDKEFRKKEGRACEIKILKSYPVNQRILMEIDVPSDFDNKIYPITLYGMDKSYFRDKTWRKIQDEFVKLNDILKNIYEYKKKEWMQEVLDLADKWLKRETNEVLINIIKDHYPFPAGVFINFFNHNFLNSQHFRDYDIKSIK